MTFASTCDVCGGELKEEVQREFPWTRVSCEKRICKAMSTAKEAAARKFFDTQIMKLRTKMTIH